MAELAVTAIGADRPGIISRVTSALRDRGGNLTDSSMTILAGHFAIMLLVEIDDTPQQVEAALSSATEDLGLAVRVAAVGPGTESPPATHTLSVYGSDRPGIVAQASAALADLGINVTDLRTRVLTAARDVYACWMEIAVPAEQDPDGVVAAVRDAVEGVDVSIQPLDVETF